MSRSVQRRLLLGYAVVLVLGAALAGGAAWSAFGHGGEGACTPVHSSSPDAARAVTATFVRDILVPAKPSCSDELATPRLLARLRALPYFRTRYPLVAYRFARPDSRRTQAVYVLGGAADGGIRLDERVPEALVLVGLAAPDAGEAGYRVTLRLQRGSWRVDRVLRVAV